MMTILLCYSVLCLSVAAACDYVEWGKKPWYKIERQDLVLVSKILLYGWAIPIKVSALVLIDCVKTDIFPRIGSSQVRLLIGASNSDKKKGE